MDKRFLILTVILGVILLAGLAAGETKARKLTPEEWCNDRIFSLGSADRNSFYQASTERCWIRYTGRDVKSILSENICYPFWDVFQYTEHAPDDFKMDVSRALSGWNFIGCMDANPQNNQNNVIVDPERGSHNLGQGADFNYEAQTCDGRCRVALSALTGSANRALGSAPGKVIGKSYVQIFDQSGNLDYGSFTLCLSANGADAPAFYRFGGGNGWLYIGGYWKGNQFCMNGTMSGNYILVD